jgi:hypothetical protein
LQISQGKSDLLLHNVHERYQTLIDLNIYYPISITDVKAWCNNFSNPVHRFVSGYILDRLIYRSSSMAKSSYTSFLLSVMRDVYYDYKKYSPPDTLQDWQHRLSSSSEKIEDFFIAPVRLLTDSGASGDTVCRLVAADPTYTKHITATGFEQRDDKKTEIPSGKVLMLVDDLLGSGEQVKKLVNQKNLAEWCEKNKVVYAPLIAMERGLERISNDYPFLDVRPIEILEEDQHLLSFKQGAKIRIDNENYLESDVIDAYEEMLNLYGMLRNSKGKIKDSRFGHDWAALPLAFEWGCPNQAISLLWWTPDDEDKNNPWTQLFRRRGVN